MGKLKLPRLISDGMILQHKKKVRIWGEDEPGRTITITFIGADYTGVTNENGEWEIFLNELHSGGDYKMYIRDDAGEEKVIEDVMIGDVWICSGQSNMELPMRRVIDRYPYEMFQCQNDCVRTFKITEHSDFHGPVKEVLTGEWKSASKDTLLDFSATAYFFAKQLYQMTGIPMGVIDASLGGSRIESWMGRDMLEGYQDILALADKYSDDDFVRERLEKNERQAYEWHSSLDSRDLGLQEKWMREDLDISDWKETDIPFFFNETELDGFIGSVWFRREFTVSKKLVEKDAKLWLGTIVDSDTVYVNGVQVGHTEYQYPPRKYVIPAGLLREGRNTIVIRVKSEIGQGRFTDGKRYAVFNDKEEVRLMGIWKYRIGASCEMIPETDFVNWKPTGLYNGMIAPCHKYVIAGVVWYQGESATRTPRRYYDLMKRLINGYREKWEEAKLPFFYVQLPNFSAEIYDSDRDETFSDWPRIREMQRKVLKIPGTSMTVTIDAGEDNDLHPVSKEIVGARIAMQAAAKLYGKPLASDGPILGKVEVNRIKSDESSDKTLWQAVLRFKCAESMRVRAIDKGEEIKDFEILDDNGVLHTADVEIEENKITLTCETDTESIREIRYCYSNTFKGALIYNSENFPMSPFRFHVRKVNQM